MRERVGGVLGLHDPLDWDPDPQAESTEPAVSTSHKSTRLCRIANSEFIFSSVVFLPLCEDRFSTIVRSNTKESAIITAIIDHYSLSPTRVLVNCGTKKPSETDSVSWFKQQGGSSCQLKPTACKLNPVAYSQVYSVQWSFATINRPAEPQTDPEARQHLARPRLFTGKDPMHN